MIKQFYILYNIDDELPACCATSIKEIMEFLGAKNENSTRSLLSRYFRGDHSKIRDSKGRYYTAAKYKEKDLL